MRLRAGALELVLSPEVGGSISRFDLVRDGDREPLMRAAPDGSRKVLEAACFPLAPFANRIRNGTFACDGRTIALTPNMAGDRSPLHGQAWLGRWTVEAADERSARLAFHHAGGEWPWTYEVRQAFSLDEGGLSVALACRNLSAELMPCGLGLHPYFPCNRDTALDAVVEAVWTIDAEVLPVAREAASGRYRLAGRAICGQNLDNGYDGWDGTARITWPDRAIAVEITSPDATRFQVFSPPDGGFFVAEPVQNANAALNAPQAQWPSLGLTRLTEGEEAGLRARFTVHAPR
ncbi:MAG TPA: aldose 1-epimerase [Caulobacteraceae bacterium]|nr:aldose 1-epimerase [Caulobacteraceae bacterium]